MPTHDNSRNKSAHAVQQRIDIDKAYELLTTAFKDLLPTETAEDFKKPIAVRLEDLKRAVTTAADVALRMDINPFPEQVTSAEIGVFMSQIEAEESGSVANPAALRRSSLPTECFADLASAATDGLIHPCVLPVRSSGSSVSHVTYASVHAKQDSFSYRMETAQALTGRPGASNAPRMGATLGATGGIGTIIPIATMLPTLAPEGAAGITDGLQEDPYLNKGSSDGNVQGS